MSVFVDLFNQIAVPMTEDLLLAAIYGVSSRYWAWHRLPGGDRPGYGYGAQLVARFFPTVWARPADCGWYGDCMAGIAFGLELAMYALIAVFITTKTVDVVQEGPNYAKACLIISDHPEPIGESIMQRLERGVTMLDGRGMYTKYDKEVLLVIVSRMEIAAVKSIVAEVDRKAFVIIYDVHEVLGEGFRGL